MTLPPNVLNAVKIEVADPIPSEEATDAKEGVEDGCNHLQGMESRKFETTVATAHPLGSSEALGSKTESSGRKTSDSHLPCGEDGSPACSRDQIENAVFAPCEEAKAAEIDTVDAKGHAEGDLLVGMEDSMREQSQFGPGPTEDVENSEGKVTPEGSAGTLGENHRPSERPIDGDQDPAALRTMSVPELTMGIAEEISPASQSAIPQNLTTSGTSRMGVKVCKQEEFPVQPDIHPRLSSPPQSSGLDTFSEKFMALNMACGHLIRYNRPRTWRNIQLLCSGSQHTLSLEDVETLALYFPQMVTLKEVGESEGKDTIVQIYDPFDPKVNLEIDPKRDLDLDAKRAVERRQKSFNLFLLQFNERLRSSPHPQSQEDTTQSARRHEDFAAKQMATDSDNYETGPVILALSAPQLNANPSPLPPRVRVQAPSRLSQLSSFIRANVQTQRRHVYTPTIYHEDQKSGQQAPCQAQDTTQFAGGFHDHSGPMLQIQPHPPWQSDSSRSTTAYHFASSHEIVQAPTSTLVQTVQSRHPASLDTNHVPPLLLHTQFIPMPVQASPVQEQALSLQQAQSGSNQMTEIHPRVGILFHMEPHASKMQAAPSRSLPSHHRLSFRGFPPHYMQAAAGHAPQDEGPPAKTQHLATSPSSSPGTPPFVRNVSHWSQTAAQMPPGFVPISSENSETMLQMTPSAYHQGPPVAMDSSHHPQTMAQPTCGLVPTRAQHSQPAVQVTQIFPQAMVQATPTSSTVTPPLAKNDSCHSQITKQTPFGFTRTGAQHSQIMLQTTAERPQNAFEKASKVDSQSSPNGFVRQLSTVSAPSGDHYSQPSQVSSQLRRSPLHHPEPVTQGTLSSQVSQETRQLFFKDDCLARNAVHQSESKPHVPPTSLTSQEICLVPHKQDRLPQSSHPAPRLSLYTNPPPLVTLLDSVSRSSNKSDEYRSVSAIPPQLTLKDAHRSRDSSYVNFEEHHPQTAARTIPQISPAEYLSRRTARTMSRVSPDKHPSETSARTGSLASPIDHHNWAPSPVSLDKHLPQTTAQVPLRLQIASMSSPDMISFFRNNTRHRDGTKWELWQVVLLIQAKKIEVERLRSSSAQSPVETIGERWRNVELWLKHRSVEDKDAYACREKWESLLDDYKDIDRWRSKFPAWPYHLLTPSQKKVADLPPDFASDLIDLMDTFVKLIDETPPVTQSKVLEVSSDLVDHTSDPTLLNEPSTEDCDRGASSGVRAPRSGSERSEDAATPSSHSDGGNLVRDGEASGGVAGATNGSDMSESEVIPSDQDDGAELLRDREASGGTTAARNESKRCEDEVIPAGLGDGANVVPASAVIEVPTQRVSLEGAIDRLTMSFCELHKSRDQRMERRLALKEQELQLKSNKRRLAEQGMVDQRLERPDYGSSDRYMALEEQRLQVKKSKLQLEQRREEMDMEDHRITMGAFCTLASAFRKLADQMAKSP